MDMDPPHYYSFEEYTKDLCWVPYSFLLYINELANGSYLSESCVAYLYADDLLVYKIINDPRDYSTSQSDIHVHT